VVAGEVRSLARRSAESAREIRQLIQMSVARVAEGSGRVDRAGATMSDIVQRIREVSTLVNDISVASRAQSSAVREAGHSVARMDEGTQQNAALVEQSAAAADSLRQQSQRLLASVSSFRLA
jgi:methyl-accepting chemotaxis protein